MIADLTSAINNIKWFIQRSNYFEYSMSQRDKSTVNKNRSINKIFIEFMNPDNYEIYRIKSMHSSILKFSIGYEVLLNQ